MTYEAVKQAILHFLENFALPLADIEKLSAPWPGCEAGLITLTNEGVRANMSSFWWRSARNPFLVVTLLKLLHIPISNQSEIVGWIGQQQRKQGYFGKGPLGIKVSEATYHACTMLDLLGSDRTGLQNGPLVDLLRAQQQPGQRRHFAFLYRDRSSTYAELEIAFCNIASLKTLGLTVPYPDSAVNYLQRKQKRSGEFKVGWVKQQPYRTEKAALDLISALQLMDSNLKYPDAGIAELQRWQIGDGGFSWLFASHPDHYAGLPVISNLFETSRTLVTLYLLGAEPLDKAAAIDWLWRLWEPEQGYFRQLPADSYNVAYTLTVFYLGVLSLAVLGAIELPERVDLRKFALFGVAGV